MANENPIRSSVDPIGTDVNAGKDRGKKANQEKGWQNTGREDLVLRQLRWKQKGKKADNWAIRALWVLLDGGGSDGSGTSTLVRLVRGTTGNSQRLIRSWETPGPSHRQGPGSPARGRRLAGSPSGCKPWTGLWAQWTGSSSALPKKVLAGVLKDRPAGQPGHRKLDHQRGPPDGRPAACRRQGHRHWTLRQLAHRWWRLKRHPSMSHEGVRKRLKKTLSSPGREGMVQPKVRRSSWPTGGPAGRRRTLEDRRRPVVCFVGPRPALLAETRPSHSARGFRCVFFRQDYEYHGGRASTCSWPVSRWRAGSCGGRTAGCRRRRWRTSPIRCVGWWTAYPEPRWPGVWQPEHARPVHCTRQGSDGARGPSDCEAGWSPLHPQARNPNRNRVGAYYPAPA